MLIHPVQRLDSGMKANAIPEFERLLVEFLVCDESHSVIALWQDIYIEKALADGYEFGNLKS